MSDQPTTPRAALVAFAAYLDEHAAGLPLAPGLIADVAREHAAGYPAEQLAAEPAPEPRSRVRRVLARLRGER